MPIQTGDEAIGPLEDFALEVESRATRPAAAKVPDPVMAPARPITGSFDLPLFKDRRTSDDPPFVAPPAVPRAPLSVRRPNPVAPRSSTRASVDEPVLELGIADPPQPVAAPVPSSPASAVGDEAASSAAPAGLRLVAALVDAIILLTIGSIVLYLTLRICGLPLSRLSVIPPVPFLAFLLLIAGGYFTLFTAAGGQTIGKMAAGIKVVSIDEEYARVSLGHSVLRAAAYAVSALPAGLGFLPALLSADKRAVHDRIAATRVVKA